MLGLDVSPVRLGSLAPALPDKAATAAKDSSNQVSTPMDPNAAPVFISALARSVPSLQPAVPFPNIPPIATPGADMPTDEVISSFLFNLCLLTKYVSPDANGYTLR